MSQAQEQPLPDKDVGQLLVAKGRELEQEPDDPEQVIREIMETIGRSETVRKRHGKVGMNGTISVGRDLSHQHGVVLFLSDEGEGDEGDE